MPHVTNHIPEMSRLGPFLDVHIGTTQDYGLVCREYGWDVPTPLKWKAIVDTGTQFSFIRADVTRALGLGPDGFIEIETSSSPRILCYTYTVRFLFENEAALETTVIQAPAEDASFECPIGRDILAHAILVYNGPASLFSLSF